MKRRKFLAGIGVLAVAFVATAAMGVFYPAILYRYVALLLGVYRRRKDRQRFGRSPALPRSLTYPGKDWKRVAPEEAGLDLRAWNEYLARQRPVGSSSLGENHSGQKWGAAIAINGYLVHTWGNPRYLYQSASVGKALTKFALQLAIDRGLIRSENDLVRDYWTGDGRVVNGKPQGKLSHPHKYLDNGKHKYLTFRHLAEMHSGFQVSNGHEWPGDPFYDNYAIDYPGVHDHYSSGGFWRLTQALTYIFQRDLKSVLDDMLFRHIGILPTHWYWLSGEHVSKDLPAPDSGHKVLYPKWPGYGRFVDPPYSMETHEGKQFCVGGGGWAALTPLDLARIGLLIATRGVWKGTDLISSTWLLHGHGGGNDSLLGAINSDNVLMSWGQVTTSSLKRPEPEKIFPSISNLRRYSW